MIANAEKFCLSTGGHRPRLHGYVFKSCRFHFVAFSNRSALDCVFKCLRFDDRFHRFCVNRKRNRTISLRFQMKTYPCNRGHSNESDKVWGQRTIHFIDLFTTRHKVVHNGGSPNFKGSLFDKKTNYLAQILQSLSYKVYSIILQKFTTFVLFIPILGTSAIMDQTACCYDVTTSEIGS